MGRSAELKNGLKVDFGAFWSILGGVNGSQIGNFDQKIGVSKAIFAFQRPPRALKMPKSYLESSAEFKNGLKVEIGGKLSILEPFYELTRSSVPPTVPSPAGFESAQYMLSYNSTPRIYRDRNRTMAFPSPRAAW